MLYEPRFTITAELLNRLNTITVLHTRIQDASLHLPRLPILQQDSAIRSAHGTSAIEGNPLTLEQARTILEGGALPQINRRAEDEVRNAAKVVEYIHQKGSDSRIDEDALFTIHRILGEGNALDRGPIGQYRNYGVQVGDHVAPHFSEVPKYINALLYWVNETGKEWHPVVSSAILHFRFENIHPFGDGNGRAGRALAMWELTRRKFDSLQLFAVDETLWLNRTRYYNALHETETRYPEDLTPWILFIAEMLVITLERTWERVMTLSQNSTAAALTLTPNQQQLLRLLRTGPRRPADLQRELHLTKPGFHFVLKPLLAAGLVHREGGHKSGVYRMIPHSV